MISAVAFDNQKSALHRRERKCLFLDSEEGRKKVREMKESE